MLTLFSYLVKIYRYIISPLYPPCCRYTPTCSSFMLEAIKIHGAFGIILGVIRIIRCNPFAGHGLDPVPLKIKILGRNKNEKR